MNKVSNWWNSLTDVQKTVVRFGAYAQTSLAILTRVLFLFLLGMPQLEAAKILVGLEAVFFLIFFKILEQELGFPAPWTRLDRWLDQRYGDHG